MYKNEICRLKGTLEASRDDRHCQCRLNVNELLENLNRDFKRELELCMNHTVNSHVLGNVAFRVFFDRLVEISSDIDEDIYKKIEKAGGYNITWMWLIAAVCYKKGFGIEVDHKKSMLCLAKALHVINKNVVMTVARYEDDHITVVLNHYDRDDDGDLIPVLFEL